MVHLDGASASVAEAGTGTLLGLLGLLLLAGLLGGVSVLRAEAGDAGADAVVDELVLVAAEAGGALLLGGLGATEDGGGVGITALDMLLDGSL